MENKQQKSKVSKAIYKFSEILNEEGYSDRVSLRHAYHEYSGIKKPSLIARLVAIDTLIDRLPLHIGRVGFDQYISNIFWAIENIRREA